MTRVYFLFFLFSVVGIAAQQNGDAPPEPEAPAQIFDYAVGDVGVVLEADGTWTTRLVGGWGAGFSQEGVLPGLGYPGYEKGVVFSQVPDFTLTLRLMERYYLEVVYAGTEDRSFLVGYQGKPGEVVQWVKLGNAPFGVLGRAGERPAEGRMGAPALGVGLRWDRGDLEFLARYEDGAREVRTYRGYSEVSESPLSDWIRGRFFRIPGPYPLSGVRVLVADPEGNLGTQSPRYRRATDAEVSIDAATGEVRLATPATRPFLVTWDQAEDQRGAASPLLQIPIEEAPALGPETWFVLFRPGAPSFFEIRNRYPRTQGPLGLIAVVDEEGNPVPNYPITYSTTQDWFEVGGPAEAPFWSEGGLFRGLYPQVDDPVAPPATALKWTFRSPASSATSYSLGTDVSPSSLVITRNGITVGAYTFDATTGNLTLNTPVFETDTVVVSFQRQDDHSRVTDLVLWQGGRWNLSDQQFLEWALQGRWNLEDEAYTTEDLEAPGRMAASLSWEADHGEWAWLARGTLGALLADSTGHRRIYGWSEGGAKATLDGDGLRPAAAPGFLGGLNLTPGNRAPTYFRDYWTNDVLTGKPQVGAWGKPGVGIEPWEAGGWMGPYLVRGDGQRSDRLVVVETDLGAGTWSGAQVFFDSGASRDLGATAALVVHYRLVDGQSGDRLFLQAGTLAEDLDGTGALRSMEYRSHPALPFVDQGVRRYFPVPEDSDWGNDDGDLTPGIDGDLVTFELDPVSDSEWTQQRILLTPYQRQLLTRTTGWRIVVANSLSTGGTRTLLVGPVVFEGSTWSVVPDGLGGKVNPVEESDPSRTDGHHLRVDWSGQDSWTIEGQHSPVRPASYGALAFRYKLDSNAQLTIKLTDNQGRGLEASWNATGSGEWVDARVDWRDEILTLDGQTVEAVVRVRSATAWDRMTISVSQAGPSGTLFFSEVEAVDPIWEPLGTTVFEGRWTQPSDSGLPWVSGMVVNARSTQGGLTADQAFWQGDSTVTGTFGPMRLKTEAVFTRSPHESTDHGAYEATIPLVLPGVTLEWTDRFSDQGLRSQRMTLSGPWTGDWELLLKAQGIPDTLDQQYRLSWSLANEVFRPSFGAQWDQSGPTDLVLQGFGLQWWESWSWFVPPEELASYHRVQADVGLQTIGRGWNLDFKGRGAATQSLGSGVKWTPEGTWSLKVPWRPSDQWSLTPSVSKKVDGLWVGDRRTPGESALDGGSWLVSQDGGLFFPPFVEFLVAHPWDDQETASVTSTAGLEWTRAQGSQPSDLVVPASATAKLATLRGRDTAEYQSATVSGSLQARALNVFGSLGTQPLFNWYRTDVWTWMASGSKTVGTRSETGEAAMATRVDWIVSEEETLSLPSSYQGRWDATPSQTLSLKPSWTLKHTAELPFEVPRWLSPKDFRRTWVQEVSGVLDLGWDALGSPVVRNFQVGWKGRYLLSDKSEVDFTTRWGQQWQTTVAVVGLEASIDLILSF